MPVPGAGGQSAQEARVRRPARRADHPARGGEFQRGYLAVLDGEPDPHRAARAGSRYVVGWSGENPREAALLLYGAADFGRADRSGEHTARADSGNGTAALLA
ncbi:hypothetical protein [Streptomyces sp. MJM1172]|uniref:hypothetical protein n=1 Tax=Streptomyces sp. MJM1172 TaxID=1703926 RepID=UPI0018E951AC|nr:hypothetical protein [Streptomyces sp. MJM1172]